MYINLQGQVADPEVVRENFNKIREAFKTVDTGGAVWGGITGSIGDQTDLISGGKILSSLLPAIAITDTSVVSSEAEMLALTAETGDICVRTDETKTYILKGTDPSVLADWELLLTPTGGVVSVFGRSGAVTAQSGDYSFSLISGTAGPTQGGTGLTTYAKGDVLIATGTNTVGVVSASATDGYVFTWDNASGLPMWKAASGGLPSMTGNNGKFLTTNGTAASWAAVSGWSITGNAGTVAGTNFIGTTDDVDFIIKRNNITLVQVLPSSFFFGLSAGSSSGTGNFCFGTFAGSSGTSNNINCFGYYAGNGSTGIDSSNFFGYYAGKNASGSFQSNFFGQYAGNGTTNAFYSNFYGRSAGAGATGAKNSNFHGYQAGYQAVDASYCNLFGLNAGMTFTGNNIGKNNIIIGTNCTLPNATQNALNLGNTLYGINLLATFGGTPSIVPQATGKIGIGIVTPTSALHIRASSGSANDTPFKLTAGTNVTTPEDGAFEYDGTHLYFTIGTTRNIII